MHKPCLMALAPHDKLATVTALTCRTVYDFFRREYHEPNPPEAIILSGGGANNLSLVKYFATYFGHLPLTNCEELGIPVEMRIPLSLGLSVDAFFKGTSDGWEDGATPHKGPRCRLTMP